MKTAPYIVTFIASVVLVSCSKPKPVVVPGPVATPQSTPGMSPRAKPIPIPSPSAEPRSQTRLAPEGILYVTESFKVTTENGIIGFPKGKKVTLIREEGDQCIVTDGKVEGKSSRDSFTNDLDIADTALAEANGTLHAIQQSHRSWKQARADRTDSTRDEFAKEQAQEKQEERSKAIALLQSHRSALSARISAAQSERESKGFPRDGGSRSSYRGSHGSHKTTRLGADATQIQQLLEQRSRLEAQLRQLESL